VIVLLLLEGLMRRDISMPIKERIYQVAFVFLVLFAAMVIFNDLAKTVPGMLHRMQLNIPKNEWDWEPRTEIPVPFAVLNEVSPCLRFSVEKRSRRTSVEYGSVRMHGCGAIYDQYRHRRHSGYRAAGSSARAAGSELVRVTVNNEEAAAAVAPIVEQLDKQGINVPIIGDFHYNGHILLKKYPDCARHWPSTASTLATSA